MKRKTLLLTCAIGLGVASLSGCATVSEETCIAGSWEALGYKDGRNGKSRGHFADIAETCAKYGITPNATQYRLGYDQGLPLYCSYDKGFSTGDNGNSPKEECLAIGADNYVDGHRDGYASFVVRSEYEDLIDEYNDVLKALDNVSERLLNETLPEDERKRLRKKRKRLERDLDDARIDIRAFERIEGWPKRDLRRTAY